MAYFYVPLISLSTSHAIYTLQSYYRSHCWIDWNKVVKRRNCSAPFEVNGVTMSGVEPHQRHARQKNVSKYVTWSCPPFTELSPLLWLADWPHLQLPTLWPLVISYKLSDSPLTRTPLSHTLRPSLSHFSLPYSSTFSLSLLSLIFQYLLSLTSLSHIPVPSLSHTPVPSLSLLSPILQGLLSLILWSTFSLTSLSQTPAPLSHFSLSLSLSHQMSGYRICA